MFTGMYFNMMEAFQLHLRTLTRAMLKFLATDGTLILAPASMAWMSNVEALHVLSPCRSHPSRETAMPEFIDDD